MSVVRCAWCEVPIDLDIEDSEEVGEEIMHIACASDHYSQHDDHRFDDPRHGQARDLNRG